MTQGIYLIKSLHNNKVYVGSSKHIEKRFKEHISKLKQGKHHSWKLQKHYNEVSQYYVDNNLTLFELYVLEQVDDYASMLAKEIRYILQYDAVNNGFNCIYDSKKYGRYLAGYK